MTSSTLHASRVAIAAGALALLAAACGSDSDSSPNSDTGSGTGLVSVSSVDGTPTLADSSGKTLYTADVEENGQIKCVDACATFWEPLMASPQQAETASSRLGAEFDVVDRPDGGTQLTYEGLPLYTFAQEDAGELEGNGFVDDFEGTHFEWVVAGSDGSVTSSPPTDGGGRYDY